MGVFSACQCCMTCESSALEDFAVGKVKNAFGFKTMIVYGYYNIFVLDTSAWHEFVTLLCIGYLNRESPHHICNI